MYERFVRKMKKYVLIIQYLSGEIAVLTNHNDLNTALNKFIETKYKQLMRDKSAPLPEIISAKVVPLMYDSIYEENINE